MKPVFPFIAFAAIVSCATAAVRTPEAVEFRTDVMALLSKAGCNAGGCHGNGQGKGGLKLSLRGQDPDLDWQALARDEAGRRINFLEPEQSLVLLKASASIAHEGGTRLSSGSPEFNTLLAWLRDGGPDSGKERKLATLDVTPRDRIVVEPETTVQLHAVAKFADGSERDVTATAVYEPNNMAVKVAAGGLVTREKSGETTVLVRYLDRQIPVHLAFVPARPDFAWSNPKSGNFIDDLIFKKLRTLRMNPSDLCSDAVFLRRATLDLLGLVPDAEMARAFAADTSPDKRAQLVDRLLQREEFADFWALKWADLLKIEERQLDTNGMRVFHGWIRESIAKNKPLDVFAREILAGRGSTYQNPEANWWRANRDPVTRAENTARVFLGTQINCAQCHNHPFERWTQDDYYGWTALFARLDYKIIENKKGDKNDRKEFKGDQIVEIKTTAPVLNARTGKPAAAKFLGDRAPKITSDRDELLDLAEWLPHVPQFARMQVNRVWFQLMGRGIVDPVDDFRASNPPVNPELLDRLAQEFAQNGYDLRRLIRTIMASRVYQLSSKPNATNADDEINFSHEPIRRLGAEQLLDSMSAVLGAPLDIPDWPGAKRVAQVPEGRKHYRPLKDDLDRFELAFGKPPRLVASDCERSNEPTVVQAFQLVSGRIVQQLLTSRDNRIGSLLATTRPDAEIISELYVAALSREPSAAELEGAKKHLASKKDRRGALEDIAWALLNAKEFLFRQ